MNTKDGFVVTALKMLLSIVSLVIILPMIYDNGISFYVTISVYVLGKFIELVSKIIDRSSKLFFKLYVMGAVDGMAVVGMCFYRFACLGTNGGYVGGANVGSGAVSNVPTINLVLMVMTVAFSFIDIADFIYCICKLYFTKKKLNQFG